MNIRKGFLIFSCLLSGVAVFLPLYSLKYAGEYVDGCHVMLSSSFWGIGLALVDLFVIVTCIFSMKKCYVIGSLISIGLSIRCLVTGALSQTLSESMIINAKHIANTLDKSGTSIIDYSKYSVANGPAYFMLIFGAILIFITMIWNVMYSED